MRKLAVTLALASVAGALPASSYAQSASTITSLATSLSSSALSQLTSIVQSQNLTGDVGLACEAILCLSSGTRPTECAASIARYFSISYKFWSDTLQGRINFLNLCPVSGASGMSGLVNAIANGAGQCDAASLNRNIIYIPKEVCDGEGQDRYCQTKMIPVISPQEPGYCVSYTTNAYTYQLALKYVGDPMSGGHWVNATTGQ